jgi:hypothetical protein
MPTLVFVSSTFYDLIDIRAEVEAHLRGMSLQPLMSGRITSQLIPLPDANSIETCLTHVRKSDYVIVILNNRYGPRLGKVGFEDVSATHLEYREAVRQKKPIRFYVRDRLDADHSTWKKNKRTAEIALPWIGDDGSGLLEFIEEHKALSKGGPNNWYDTFRDSIELKQLISRDFQAPAGRESIISAVASNALPFFDVRLDVQHNRSEVSLNVIIKNIGKSPAFDVVFFHASHPDTKAEPIPILAPQQNTSSPLITFRGMGSLRKSETLLAVHYRLLSGHHVRELHFIFFEPQGSGWKSGTTLRSKKFYLATDESLPFSIEDGPPPD